MEEVAELLGHEDESDMTRRYTHLLPASRQAAADRTNLLFPAKEQTK
jgi:integrase